MKTKKIKKNKLNDLRKVEVDFYKRDLIFNEFEKIIEDILFFELDEELYEFIKDVISFQMIADFSDYGDDVFNLDFMDYYEGDKCFLCFIKFDLDDFIDCMIYMNEDMKLKNS
jgi:hypothetical protein